MNADLDNFICTCGHRRDLHNIPPYGKLYYMDGACLTRDVDTTGDWCMCQKYVADNLKFMQKIYEEPSNEK